METIDIQTWNRRQHYEHFRAMKDPFFALTVTLDVSNAYGFAKEKKISFFGRYLHDCLKAINDVEPLKLRIENENVIKYETIHASPTIIRENKTFGFTFIEFDKDLDIFLKNLELEKQRVFSSDNLYPPINGLDCVHCSALPWLSFSGHKEPDTGLLDSVPKLAFAKAETKDGILMMNVAIRANHALVDGYDVGLFIEKFQDYLNE